MRFLSLSILLISFAAFTTLAQGLPSEKIEITEKQRTDLQSLARRFVADFQRTRDIEPLLHQYFVDDFFAYDPEPSELDMLWKLPKRPTKEEIRRGFVAGMNNFYIFHIVTFLADTEAVEAGPMMRVCEQSLPTHIAQNLSICRDEFPGKTDNDITRQQFVNKVESEERALSKALEFLKTINLEHRSKYLQEFERSAADPKLNYRVEVRNYPEGILFKSGKRRMRLSPGTYTYTVTTPILFAPTFVNVKGQYKILRLQIYIGN